MLQRLVVLSAIALGGCATTQPPAPVSPARGPSAGVLVPPAATAGRVEADRVEARLVSHYQAWKGTPYAFGGSGRGGVDCSGLVQLTYARLYGVSLPRTTRDLRWTGAEIAPRELRPGDLVFFDEARKDSHVGIYLGDGRFMHASTRRGVTADRLDSRYWRTRFSAAVRPVPSPS